MTIAVGLAVGEPPVGSPPGPARRGLQDVLARTVVVDAPGPSIADVSRAKKRAIYEASRREPPALPE